MSQQKDLQLQIVQRQRLFGMKPVLPGFAGHVPKALQRIYPNASISQVKKIIFFPAKIKNVFLPSCLLMKMDYYLLIFLIL